MTTMLSHYDPASAALTSLYEHHGHLGHPQVPGGQLPHLSHHGHHPHHHHPHHAHHHPHHQAAMQPKRFHFKMPRVVRDQKQKFENDELFRRLARESEVRYTAHRERPTEERKLKFQTALKNGCIEIAIVSNGTNINLTFSHNFNNNNTNTKEVECEKENGKVHIRSSFILNGVCVRWKGWLDCERLDGLGVVEFDEDSARDEHALFEQECANNKSLYAELQSQKERNLGLNPSATAVAAAVAAASRGGIATPPVSQSLTSAAASAVHHSQVPPHPTSLLNHHHLQPHHPHHANPHPPSLMHHGHNSSEQQVR